ncbi:glycosyltransferase family 2 protein [Paenibacillus phocaensis]|uniref:glycosyltransferase family 2 protein n=1 Tax=Paenibacillus phocaensis TaxID=1776378 RepID=UPI000ADAAB49|nr:glycosyltransferase family 2 protein [Paenibacillus phocaensis]
MDKPTVSLCMIVKNEERCIERCLNSVAPLVDEVIIVDTGSSDRTLELVNKYDAKLFYYEWDNHFANARNYAIEQATGEYILQLDADEWIDDPVHELNQRLDKEIYYIPIRNDLGGGLAEVHKFPRLFRNIPELRYEGALHEQINITTNWHRSSAVLSQVTIHHDGYLNQIVNSKGKKERNLKILYAEIKDNPSAFNYFNLGQQYFTMGEYRKAVDAYKKAYNYGGEFTFTKRLLLGMIQSLMLVKQFKDALSIANDSFQLYPDYVEFKYYEGLIYQEIGYLPDAQECFEECIKTGDSDPSVHFNTYEGTGSYLANARLAEIAYMNFNFEQSEAYLNQAISQAPRVMGLLKSYLDFNRNIDARKIFDQITVLWPQNQEVLQQLIYALYQLRHPAIHYFLDRYNVDCDQEVMAFINMVAGDFAAAEEYWTNKQECKEENLRDVLLLSVAQKNKQLLDRYLGTISLRHEEKRALLAFCEMQDIKCGEFSREFREMVYILLSDLLKIQKYEFLDYFTKQFSTPQMRLVLAQVLYDYGFYEILLEVLVQGSNQEDKFHINLLAAKTLRHLNSWEDSLYYYQEAYKIKPNSEVAFHICNLAIHLNDVDTIKFILGKMMDWDVVSTWMKHQLFN